ncbi:hypothetical protein H6F67_05565 [Microcoleus sp. FACHB-1515]|uniref:hypothetical protein n=1 Tax=Cyanophyceae TaxID=3028117 RepID=UPI001688D074|nr:hypothetical protein [Microcoleus sp. FACHB-1515]MBD2089319.1 hypothetical protein [Microcoleus sp. FACHB-1515]
MVKDPLAPIDAETPDPLLRQQMRRLHEVTVQGRWAVTIAAWLTIGLLSLWQLRSEFALWREYFTWAAVRYGLAFNPLSAIGLATCIGLTVSVLLWQSHNILFGISQRQVQRLKKQVLQIRQQGSSHPLWKRVIDDRK